MAEFFQKKKTEKKKKRDAYDLQSWNVNFNSRLSKQKLFGVELVDSAGLLLVASGGWRWLKKFLEINRNVVTTIFAFFASSSTRLQRGWSVPAPNSSIDDVRLKTHRGDFFLLCFSKKQRKLFFSFKDLDMSQRFLSKTFAALLTFFPVFFDKFINFHFFD